MFVIFGIAPRTKRLATGSFLCPFENRQTSYEQFQQSEWFSLFFIPIVKIREDGGYVQCQSCGTRYPESVLTQGATTPA